jgi:hypothetical protein
MQLPPTEDSCRQGERDQTHDRAGTRGGRIFPMYLTFVTLVLAVAIGAIIVEIKNGQPSVLSTVKF